MIRLLSVAFVLCLTVSKDVNAQSFTRISDSLNDVSDQVQQLHRAMLAQYRNRETKTALATAAEIVQQIEVDGGNPGEALLNLSLLAAATGDIGKALASSRRGLTAIESESGDTNRSLIRPLYVRGVLLRLSGDAKESEAVLRRAQMLIHRYQGVYSAEQNDVIDQLTLIDIQGKQFDRAIRQQHFAHKIKEVEFGEDSLELMTQTQRYATFLATLGRLTTATKLLNKSIRSIEKNHGEQSPYLISLLQDLARVKLLERELIVYDQAVPDLGPDTRWLQAALGHQFYLTGRKESRLKQAPVKLKVRDPINIRTWDEPPPRAPGAPIPAGPTSPLMDVVPRGQEIQLSPNIQYSVSVGVVDKESFRSNDVQPYMSTAVKARKRIFQILSDDPQSDPSDRIAALVALGDMYLISGSAGSDAYRQAWEMMQETPDPMVLQQTYFGQPNQIQPRSNILLPLERRGAGDYEAKLEYDVNEQGRVIDIRTVSSSVPASELHNLKRRLYQYQFRPRMKDGEFVTTKNLVFAQSYYGNH